ncbi:hypothetical protein [Micromonospora sp. NPDC047730]|uniref:hypothetical protein n=1 Tax=Micromonospora sp. NPDC047730 TaxID=3364253 RepID=UPI003713491F
MTTRDPEWSEEDVAWLLALAAYRDARCPACGGDVEECTSPASDGAFEVPAPTRCHAKTALEIAQKTYAETPQAGALLWRVKHRR